MFRAYNNAASAIMGQAFQEQQAMAESYNRFMHYSEYYKRRGMTLLKISDFAGQTSFLLEAPTRIPRVSRRPA